MSRAEQCVGIGLGGAALSKVTEVIGNYYEKKARVLDSNSFFTKLFETVTQTEGRPKDVDWYKLWSEGANFAAVSILFITAFLVAAQLTARKR